MKRLVRIFLLLLATLVVILLARTLMLNAPETVALNPADPSIRDGHLERLSRALTYATISAPDFDPESGDSLPAFEDFQSFLADSFPLSFSSLSVEFINRYSLLMTWPGQDPDRPGLLLMAHQDVVPVSRPENWQHDAFSGMKIGERVYGRGALDDKGSLMAQLEAVESLLAQGFTPPGPVYLAYGHDEEIGGRQGAAAIARSLSEGKARIGLVLDEGGAVVTGRLPGVPGPVAMVGNAEKGYLSLSLSVTTAGGHSSMPPEQTAIEILSAAITRLKESPFPTRMDVAGRQTLQHAAPHMPFGFRLVMSNLWLFEPLVTHLMSQDNATRAILQTTIATTLFNAGIKDNVLPGKASAVVNFRTLPGDSTDIVMAHVRDAIDDDRVSIEVSGNAIEASPVSSVESAAYDTLRRTILATRPETDLIVVPYLVLGGTDAKHFTSLSDQVFRFSPFSLSQAELDSIHGVDESIAITEFNTGIHFYRTLIQQEF